MLPCSDAEFMALLFPEVGNHSAEDLVLPTPLEADLFPVTLVSSPAGSVFTAAGLFDDERGASPAPVAGADADDDVVGGGQAGPTEEQLVRWRQAVVGRDRERSWKIHSDKRFQSRCFAAEWRSSSLLDRDDFLRRLFLVVGGDVSFALGVDQRAGRADYFLVVRLHDPVRWRDWRQLLMFGHDTEDESEGLFLRLLVPRTPSGGGVVQFVQEMSKRCGLYGHVSKFRDSELLRVQSRGHGRPGEGTMAVRRR